jgi:hypothetical protein
VRVTVRVCGCGCGRGWVCGFAVCGFAVCGVSHLEGVTDPGPGPRQDVVHGVQGGEADGGDEQEHHQQETDALVELLLDLQTATVHGRGYGHGHGCGYAAAAAAVFVPPGWGSRTPCRPAASRPCAELRTASTAAPRPWPSATPADGYGHGHGPRSTVTVTCVAMTRCCMSCTAQSDAVAHRIVAGRVDVEVIHHLQAEVGAGEQVDAQPLDTVAVAVAVAVMVCVSARREDGAAMTP